MTATTPADARTDTYHLELKPGRDPLSRRGINREPIYRLKRLLKFAARECGFRIRWGRNPPVALTGWRDDEATMIRFEDGPAAEQLLMLRRAPLYLRVVYDCVRQQWDALDQLADAPAAGEAVFVYKRVGEPSFAMIDWTERRRRRGGRFASATYRLATEQPDDATMRDTAKWQKWCWTQVGKQPEGATP